MDSRSLMLRRRFSLSGPIPDGLIRMDRATPYLRNSLSELIREIESKQTKNLGSASIGVSRFVREMISLAEMGGEAALIDMAMRLSALGERTDRVAAIAQLSQVLASLATFEAERDAEEKEAYSFQRRFLEEEFSEPDETKAASDVSDPKAVFIIMPFSADFNDVWRGGIQRAATELNLLPIRVDAINRSSNITEDIVQSIEKCRVAIADVTGNNPNVMFELGYAMAKSKPQVIISQSANFLPFDIRNLRTIVYANTWSGIEELKSKIQGFLKETVVDASSAGRTPKSKPSRARGKASEAQG